MDADTPITLATAKYQNRELAVEDYDRVWKARKHDQFDHTAVAVLTKGPDGKLKIDRHDSSAKHLAWAGAALGLFVPGLGIAVGAGAGAIAGHFWHNIPKDTVREAGELLESGESGLLIVAVNKKGTDIAPLLALAEKTTVMETVAGNLQADLDKELAEAKASEDQASNDQG